MLHDFQWAMGLLLSLINNAHYPRKTTPYDYYPHLRPPGQEAREEHDRRRRALAAARAARAREEDPQMREWWRRFEAARERRAALVPRREADGQRTARGARSAPGLFQDD